MNNKPINNKIHAKGVYSCYGNTTAHTISPANKTHQFRKYSWITQCVDANETDLNAHLSIHTKYSLS
jgi:hypothetical protein